MGIEGIDELKPDPKPKKQCGRKKTTGWGAMTYCLFEAGHDKGENPTPHSWSVTS